MRSRELLGWRWLLVVSPWAVFLAAACGSGDKSSAEGAAGAGGSAMGAAGEASVGDNQSNIQLTLDDVDEVLTGGARLEVREQNPVVNLAVTTVFASSPSDLVQFQLALDGVQNAMGYHRAEFSSASNSAALAVAYLQLVSYSSKSGVLEVTLKKDRTIEGHFDVVLSQDPPLMGDPAPPPRKPDFPISGSFTGTWSLVCRSPVVGLPGDHSVANSPYCNKLEF